MHRARRNAKEFSFLRIHNDFPTSIFEGLHVRCDSRDERLLSGKQGSKCKGDPPQKSTAIRRIVFVAGLGHGRVILMLRKSKLKRSLNGKSTSFPWIRPTRPLAWDIRPFRRGDVANAARNP
jgi:hypothetical protein